MPTFEIKAPDGTAYQIDAPDGATPEQAWRMLNIQLAQQSAQAEREAKVAKAEERKSLLESVGPLQAAGRAAKRTGGRLASGLQDIWMLASGDREGRQRLRESEAQATAEMAPLEEARPISTAIGGGLPYAPAGLLPGGLPAAVLGDAALSFLSYSPTLEGKLTNAAVGGAGALAGYGLGTLGAGALSQRRMGMSQGAREAYEATQNLAMPGGGVGRLEVTPGEYAGSRGMRGVEASMSSWPLLGSGIWALKGRNQRTANLVAARAIGEASESLTPRILDAADDRIGAAIQNATAGQTFDIGDDLIDALGEVERQRSAWGLSSSIRNTIDQAVDELARTNGTMTGERYNQLRSQLGKAARSAMRGEHSDPEFGMALFDIQNALDDAVMSRLPQDQAEALATARSQWRALVTLSRPGVVSAEGNVSLPVLANKLRTSDVRGYTRGGNRSDLYEVARFSKAFPQVVADSGTATRMTLPIMAATGAIAPGQIPTFATAWGLSRAYPWLARHGLLNLPPQATQIGGALGGGIGTNEAVQSHGLLY